MFTANFTVKVTTRAEDGDVFHVVTITDHNDHDVTYERAYAVWAKGEASAVVDLVELLAGGDSLFSPPEPAQDEPTVKRLVFDGGADDERYA